MNRGLHANVSANFIVLLLCRYSNAPAAAGDSKAPAGAGDSQDHPEQGGPPGSPSAAEALQ